MDQRRYSSFQPFALTLTVLAAFVRLVPHPPNFTPVGSVALFGGARLKGWQAYGIPVLVMLITDPILSHMAGYPAYTWGTLVVYGCFLINVLLGRTFLRNSAKPSRIAAVAIAGSIQFFLITNFFVWLGSITLYPHTWPGLLECYVAAIPFFGWTVLGDVFYSSVLFCAYEWVRRYSTTEKVAA